mmetsp:Transcript_24921/g.48433  ORF Transcript_24921/g.48433 Transcript_24921/m.48433 type:complete len:98 (+) Transcript_24921:87-380(+)
MLGKGKSSKMREVEYRRYVELGTEALRMRRESRNLDLVVDRQKARLLELQQELDTMLSTMREVERLFQEMSFADLKPDVIYNDEEGCVVDDFGCFMG